MQKVNVKEIREQCDQMSAGWEQSPNTKFSGIAKADFDADRAAARAEDVGILADEAALDARKDRRDNMYKALNTKRVNVRRGVSGDANFGEDSPMYGAMGNVRTSERDSGLTRDLKDDKKEGDE